MWNNFIHENPSPFQKKMIVKVRYIGQDKVSDLIFLPFFNQSILAYRSATLTSDHHLFSITPLIAPNTYIIVALLHLNVFQ